LSTSSIEDPTDLKKLINVLLELDDVVDVVHNATWEEEDEQ
jgi:transcriptional/translational regulatory protein YebC/TACO1